MAALASWSNGWESKSILVDSLGSPVTTGVSMLSFSSCQGSVWPGPAPRRV